MKKIIDIFFYTLLFLMVLVAWSCKEEITVEPIPTYNYQIPEQTNDGWETAHLTDVGINGEKLFKIIDLINIHSIKEVHSILIVKNGKLVFEEYFKGHEFAAYDGTDFHGDLLNYNLNTSHNQASVTKSFTSTLIGIALDKGHISDLNEKVYDYFPEYSPYLNDQKTQMTIEHLLGMSSGFQWNEGEYSYSDIKNDLIQMWDVKDPLSYLMSKPIVADPGAQFYYNSGCTILLGEIIKRTSDFDTEEYAQHFLFQPLGITQYKWGYFSNGVLFASGDLKLRPRDMAKLGFLYLNKGKWMGNQIISSDWIDKASKPFISVNDIWEYGYQWWIRSYTIDSKVIESYSARGWGGQTIVVLPSLDAVIVLTGGNYTAYEPVNDLLQLYLIPSII